VLVAAARIIPATGAGQVVAPGYVVCSAGRVTAIGAGSPPARPDVELADGVLLPGFIDLQVNGYFGVELATADAAGWATVSARLPETGTTSFLPTFITSPMDELHAALRRATGILAESVTAPGERGGAAGAAGARILGIHLEGPFIARKRCGAHNPAWIADLDPDTIGGLLAAGSGLVRVVTLAPELTGAMAAIKQLTEAGVLVSIGHSDATAQQVAAAATEGATMVTHLFNGQRPMHHREPGVAGQALADPRLTSGLIADLRHVDGRVAAIAFAAAPGRIFLVTDAAPCAGMPPGRYVLGGEPIDLPPGDTEPPVRVDGTLAGSALRMDAAVANMVTAGVGLVESVAAATRIPADLIGRPDLGRIAAGAAADLTWLGDDLRAKATWIAGRQVYGLVPCSSARS
jgi:N-acetylglucosamine-6-phosphate deacetylase